MIKLNTLIVDDVTATCKLVDKLIGFKLLTMLSTQKKLLNTFTSFNWNIFLF